MNLRNRFARGAWRMTALLLAIVLTAICVNVVLLGGATYFIARTSAQPRVKQHAAALIKTQTGYALPEETKAELDEEGYWAVLLNDTGDVIFEHAKPAEVPAHFTLEQVAGFSRWYLSDYPVFVWDTPHGLFVLGAPKNSLWKYNFYMPMPQLSFLFLWIPLFCLCNFLVVLAPCLWMAKRWQKQRDTAQADWIAGVSHDIRTPLSMVLGYAGALSQDDTLPPPQQRQAAVICRQGEELRARIADLNLVSRLEFSMEPAQWETVCLAALVRETAAESMNTDADELHPIDVEVSDEAESFLLQGDKALLTRMLQNLLRNCVRHNPQGCEITISLRAQKRTLRLCVEDNGTGFSCEQLAALARTKCRRLLSFARMGASLSARASVNADIGARGRAVANAKTSAEARTSTNAGTSTDNRAGKHGLGLRIVQRIVAVHGGKVQFSNGNVGGACCVITLRGRCACER